MGYENLEIMSRKKSKWIGIILLSLFVFALVTSSIFAALSFLFFVLPAGASGDIYNDVWPPFLIVGGAIGAIASFFTYISIEYKTRLYAILNKSDYTVRFVYFNNNHKEVFCG